MLLTNGSRLFFVLLVAAALAAVAAGCGGSTDATATPLKKPQFVKQANAICAAAQVERTTQGKEIAGESGGSGGSGEAEEVMAKLLEPIDAMTEQLAELGPPKGEEKEVEAIVIAFEAASAKLKAEPEAADLVSAFDKANGLATAYGLTDCSV